MEESCYFIWTSDVAEVAWVISLTSLNIATAFGVPPGLQELLKINSESSDDSLNLYSKDFVLIKNFPSHDRKGKELHMSYNMTILY